MKFNQQGKLLEKREGYYGKIKETKEKEIE